MGFELVCVPCLRDNFAFLLHDSQTGKTALFDAPEAAPIITALEARGWSLDFICLTHHHNDHIDGVEELRQHFDAKVVGAKADRHRLPPLDIALSEGDSFNFAGSHGEIIDVSGHTIGHIAFYFPQLGYCFTGDSLMAAGCGRLFEGSPELMWKSLEKLRNLPPETLICSGHDYIDANLRFAKHIDPNNQDIDDYKNYINTLRSNGEDIMPIPLSRELAANPLLRAKEPSLKHHLNMAEASDSSVFTYIRAAKDQF